MNYIRLNHKVFINEFGWISIVRDNAPDLSSSEKHVFRLFIAEKFRSCLLITQIVAWPMSFLFGWIGQKKGAKNTIYICIVAYTIIAILGTFMFADWNFLVLAALVGTVQGGVQAMSRSLFAHMIPKEQSGEFFGFFGIFEKFASILGPLLMSLVALLTDKPIKLPFQLLKYD
jgi:UMF1 family MFS transporter